MTTLEFSNEFDVLLDSYRRFKDFDDKEILDSLDFNEYEKSVFLTQAQEQLIVELYTGRTNLGSAFESTEEFRTYLRNLIKTEVLTPIKKELIGLSKNSEFFHLPDDLLFITYESALLGKEAGCKEGEYIIVIPTTQDEYDSISQNPFRRAGLRRALRLDLSDGDIEIISKYPIQEYKVRYLRRPKPIILFSKADVELTGTTINGYNDKTECELDPILHKLILERAVPLALHSKSLYMSSKE